MRSRHVTPRQRQVAALRASEQLDATFALQCSLLPYYDIVVIGAGLTGLSVASALATTAADIVIVERNASAGG